MLAWLRRIVGRTPDPVPPAAPASGPQPVETTAAYCHVCGQNATFRSYEPLDFPCKRNSFFCDACGSCARNRHVAQTILDRFPTQPGSRSLVEFAQHFDGVIWLTCTSGAIADRLRAVRRCVASEFIENVPSGQIVNGVRCEDIQAASFATGSVDLVVTEDVLEHVPFPEAAFAEIRRVLKPGGFHIGTIPVHWGRETSIARAVIEDGKLRHMLEPEYHGDPTRPEGILAFTDYGQDIVSRYCAIIGPSEVLSAHLDRQQEEDFAIYNNWVFVSQKASVGGSSRSDR
jgi:SAM-dependent methyltransferase